STLVIDQSTNQPYYSRITFTNIQGTSISYYLTGTKLIQLTSGKIMTLSENMRYLTFTFPRSDDMTIVSVSMTLEKTLFDGRVKTLHMTSEKVMVMN
ncbi:MAG: hypothetical protein AABZ44_00075, partial [Elusimicrobiota bacterium]